MIERFKNSIIYPKKIVDYRADSLVRVFLYIVFFALLLSTRTIIDVITFDGISAITKETIIDDFNAVDPTCVITDSVLTCDNEENVVVLQDYLVTYYINSTSNVEDSEYGEGYNVVIHDDKVYFILSNTVLYNINISELPEELQNFDFGLLESDPDLFYGKLFSAIDSTILSLKNVWAPMVVVFDFLVSFFMFIIFILFSSWLLKLRFKAIKFRQLFTMTVYSSTALYVILILNSLYSLSIFIVIILVVVAFRQNNQLSMELYKRLHKKP